MKGFAVSKHVSQPILSFGRLLEGGWSIDGCQQAPHPPCRGQHSSGVAKQISDGARKQYVFCVSHVMLLTCMSGQFKLMSWTMLLKDVLDGI